MSRSDCQELHQAVLLEHDLIIASNRGPFSLQPGEDGQETLQRSGGGLVTALLGLSSKVPSTWFATAMTDGDRVWKEGDIPLNDAGGGIHMVYIDPEPEAFHGYYQVIANPLLWFLQHSIWDFANAPNVNRTTWDAWENGFRSVNELFASAMVKQILKRKKPSLVMLQDYHLYLAPRMIRERLGLRSRRTLLTHFIHIPWPGPEDWGLLPPRMRQAILDGLCAVDVIGFQTRDDALNFIRTCETLLPGAKVNYRRGRVMLSNHVTVVRDFPISIDVEAIREQSRSEETQSFYQQLSDAFGSLQVILRIDRTEPSKNIVRGFQAYEELLEAHPEHIGKVQFVAILVPSRLEVDEYLDYLSAIMTAAGQVNARYGTSEWEPIRVLVGESYPRALAAMQLYDVLLVNPVADGMNLVAKEGPVINQKSGVVVLSERAGARQQLGDHALVISPIDISATADALHKALIMPMEERQERSEALVRTIEEEDIHRWLCWQLDLLDELTQRPKRMKDYAKN